MSWVPSCRKCGPSGVLGVDVVLQKFLGLTSVFLLAVLSLSMRAINGDGLLLSVVSDESSNSCGWSMFIVTSLLVVSVWETKPLNNLSSDVRLYDGEVLIANPVFSAFASTLVYALVQVLFESLFSSRVSVSAIDVSHCIVSLSFPTDGCTLDLSSSGFPDFEF